MPPKSLAYKIDSVASDAGDTPAVAQEAIKNARRAIAEGEAIVNKAIKDGPLARSWKPNAPLPVEEPLDPQSTMLGMIDSIVRAQRAGRKITAGLALTELRKRHETFTNDLPADERTWPEFLHKHVPLSPDRVSDLIGSMVHRGGMMRCTKCGTGGKCPCGCGAPYVSENRWAIAESAKAETVAKIASAFDRAAEAVAAHPEKSNRAIAAEIGCDHKTVAKARQTAAVSPPDSPPDRHIGRDGRSYPGRRRLPANTASDATPDVPEPAAPPAPLGEPVWEFPGLRRKTVVETSDVIEVVHRFMAEMFNSSDQWARAVRSTEDRVELVFAIHQCANTLTEVAQKIDQ